MPTLLTKRHCCPPCDGGNPGTCTNCCKANGECCFTIGNPGDQILSFTIDRTKYEWEEPAQTFQGCGSDVCEQPGYPGRCIQFGPDDDPLIEAEYWRWRWGLLSGGFINQIGNCIFGSPRITFGEDFDERLTLHGSGCGGVDRRRDELSQHPDYEIQRSADGHWRINSGSGWFPQPNEGRTTAPRCDVVGCDADDWLDYLYSISPAEECYQGTISIDTGCVQYRDDNGNPICKWGQVVYVQTFEFQLNGPRCNNDCQNCP